MKIIKHKYKGTCGYFVYRIKRNSILLLFLFLLVFTYSGYAADNNQTYSSPNPKINTSYLLKDMVYLDITKVFSLESIKKTFGIKGSFSYENGITSGGKIEVAVYAYNPGAISGKGYFLYNIFIDQTSVIYTKKTTLDTNISANSDDIKRYLANSKLYREDGCGLWSYKDVAPGFLRSLLAFFGYSHGSLWHRERDNCAQKLASNIPVIVEVKYSGVGTKSFSEASIPGIGVVDIQSNVVVLKHPPTNLATFCQGRTDEFCNVYRKIFTPNTTAKEDIFVACHRGKWGQPLSAGEPENTLAAVIAAEGLSGYNTKLLEMDLTKTADGHLVFLHDYVMSRLSSYVGNKKSFEMSLEEMQRYKIRLRDLSISSRTVSTFEDVLQNVKENGHFLMLDIKEEQTKGQNAFPDCTDDLCVSEKNKRDVSWENITRLAINGAINKEAEQHLIVKTYYSAQDVRTSIGVTMAKEIFWTPMIVSNAPQWKTSGRTDIQKMCAFIDDWQSKFSNNIACFETDFFNEDDAMLQSFVRNGITYQNLPHYIFAKTGRRSGIFSEDPAGSRGTVNRWGSWKINGKTTDRRGDFFWLTTIPYSKLFLITTDRPDVWNQVKTVLQNH